MTRERYGMEIGDDDTWRIVDRSSGRTAHLAGSALVGMTEEEADDLIDVLNSYEAHRLRSAPH